MEPYIGEIRMHAGSYAPRDWAFCQGQLLPIAQNQALASLLGTTYGGDGRTTFGLPDMRGRVPIHMGQGNGLNNHILGQRLGTETVTLVTENMPSHNHTLMATSNGATSQNPANQVLGTSSKPFYDDDSSVGKITNLADTAISDAGGDQPHSNMAPYMALNFIISLKGVFPSQN